jgi:hypothetical protein
MCVGGFAHSGAMLPFLVCEFRSKTGLACVLVRMIVEPQIPSSRRQAGFWLQALTISGASK